MNAAENLLGGVSQTRPNPARIEKAVKAAANRADLRRRLEEQAAFDERMLKILHAITPPPDLRNRLGKADVRPPSTRPKFAAPLIISAVCGLLITITLFVFAELENRGRFQGIESVERIVAEGNRMSGVELEPVEKKTGELGDWFFAAGYEGYSAPPELAGAPAVGARVFQEDGIPVAQVAVDRRQAILYVFRARDFGVQLAAEREWRILEAQGWAAAIRQREETCHVIAFRGEAREMKAFLRSLSTKP